MPNIRYTRGANYDADNSEASATVLPASTNGVSEDFDNFYYFTPEIFELIYEADGSTWLASDNGVLIDFSDVTQDVSLDGGAFGDVLLGGSGDDFLLGGPGGDRLDGGNGIDNVSYARTSGDVTVDLDDAGANTGEAAGDVYVSIENASGGQGNDTLFARAAGSQLRGVDGDDILNGRAGDDILNGGEGADTLIGGAGRNIASYATAFDPVSASLNAPANNAGEAAGDTYFDIDGLIGGEYNDRLATAAAGQSLDGGFGNDKLFVYGAPSLVDGGEGRDTLYINRQAPLVFAQGSLTGIESIVVRGGASIDLSAFDTAIAQITSTSTAATTATIVATGGRDTILLGQGDDIVDAGGGIDRFVLTGQIRDMSGLRLDGGDGTDTLELDGGVYTGFTDASLVDVERIVVKTQGGTVLVDVSGRTTGLEIVSAATEGSQIRLVGSSGADTIRGGAGNASIQGGLGADRLIAGAGFDTFDYDSLAEMKGDRILRFDAAPRSGDIIDLRDAAFDELGEDRQFAFLGTSAFNGVEGAMRAEVRANGDTILQFDIDGDRVADASLYVQSDAQITIDSFRGVSLYPIDQAPAPDPVAGLV